MELGDWTLYSVLALIFTGICAYYGYKTFAKTSSNGSNTKSVIKGSKIKGDIIAGDKIAGDKIAGDKIAGDKVMGNKITSKNTE